MIDRRFIMSAPLRVSFEGWESDTYRLGQCGWDISVRETPWEESLQMVMRHSGSGLYAMSAPVQIPYCMLLSNPRDLRTFLQTVVIPISAIGSDIRQVVYGRNSFADFSSANTIPHTSTVVEESLSEARIFAPNLNEKAKVVVVKPESVPELMDRILELQAPEQDRIWEEGQKRAARTRLYTQVVGAE